MICIDGSSIFIPEENTERFEYFRDLPQLKTAPFFQTHYVPILTISLLVEDIL